MDPAQPKKKGQEVKGKESQGAAGGVTVPKQYRAYAAGPGKDQVVVYLHDGVMGNIYTRVGGRWGIGDFGVCVWGDPVPESLVDPL